MLHLALLTMTLVTSQTLKVEISLTVEEYLSQLVVTPSEYFIVVSDQVSEGAAVLYETDVSGQDFAIFFFNLRLFQELSRRERRVLIGHEVGHLAPECQPLKKRIDSELCADRASLKFVSVEDVAAMLSKSIWMFPYYFARQEFVLRLAVIQEKSSVGKAKPQAVRLSGIWTEDARMYCD